MRRVTALVAAGCGAIGTPEEYAEARAEAECRQIEQCALGLYEATYRSQEDCLSERADEIEEANERNDDRDCTYLPDEASDCVRRIGGLSCEEWITGRSALACDLVWSCQEER